MVDRFSRSTRWVHWLTATFMISCILTAAVLYNGSLAVLVGHRYLVEQIHVWSGIALPVPLIVGFLSRTYRDDAHRLNRFTSRDWAWLRTRARRDGRIEVGKFNARPEAQRRPVRRLDRRPADLRTGHVLHQPQPAGVAQWRDVRARLVRTRRRPARRGPHRDGHEGPVCHDRDAHRPGAAAVGTPGTRCLGARGRRRPTGGHPDRSLRG